jgi:hypothetical protein
VRIHASRESSLEGIHLIVVCGRGLTGFLLHLIAPRLRRLLLDFLPNHAAFAGCKTSQRPANRTSLTMPARVKNFFVFFCSLFSFFGHTTPFTPKSGLIGSVNSASTTKARL